MDDERGFGFTLLLKGLLCFITSFTPALSQPSVDALLSYPSGSIRMGGLRVRVALLRVPVCRSCVRSGDRRRCATRVRREFLISLAVLAGQVAE